MSKKHSIFVDDQLDLVAAGLRDIFRNDENYEVVGSANDGNDVISFLATNSVDLVLLDASLPGKDGIDTMREIYRNNPNQKVVAYNGFVLRGI